MAFTETCSEWSSFRKDGRINEEAERLIEYAAEELGITDEAKIIRYCDRFLDEFTDLGYKLAYDEVHGQERTELYADAVKRLKRLI